MEAVLCEHQYNPLEDANLNRLTCCRVLDEHLPWKGHAVDVEGTCGRCRGQGLTVLQPLIDKLQMIPLGSGQTDGEVSTNLNTTRSAAVQRCLDQGLPKDQLVMALLGAINNGAPAGEVDALLISLGYRRAARQDAATRRATREINKPLNEKIRYRAEHPCVHRLEPIGQMCMVGPVYGCAKFSKCSDCPQDVNDVHSCGNCGHYRERVTATPLDMFVPCGVTTSPLIRAGKIIGHRDTLPKTLDSFSGAGLPPQLVTIFAEPESHVPDGWRTVWRKVNSGGPWSNLFAGLMQLLRENPHADGFLMVEDDTWLSRNLYTEICRRGLPAENCGIIRLFRMTGRATWSGSGRDWREADYFCGEKQSHGYQPVNPGQLLWGTNLVLVTAAAARAMAADKSMPTDHEDSPDIKLGKLMHKYGLSEWVSNCSLGQTDSSFPSAVGHNLSKRMEAENFVEDAGGAA